MGACDHVGIGETNERSDDGPVSESPVASLLGNPDCGGDVASGESVQWRVGVDAMVNV